MGIKSKEYYQQRFRSVLLSTQGFTLTRFAEILSGDEGGPQDIIARAINISEAEHIAWEDAGFEVDDQGHLLDLDERLEDAQVRGQLKAEIRIDILDELGIVDDPLADFYCRAVEAKTTFQPSLMVYAMRKIVSDTLLFRILYDTDDPIQLAELIAMLDDKYHLE